MAKQSQKLGHKTSDNHHEKLDHHDRSLEQKEQILVTQYDTNSRILGLIQLKDEGDSEKPTLADLGIHRILMPTSTMINIRTKEREATFQNSSTCGFLNPADLVARGFYFDDSLKTRIICFCCNIQLDVRKESLKSIDKRHSSEICLFNQIYVKEQQELKLAQTKAKDSAQQLCCAEPEYCSCGNGPCHHITFMSCQHAFKKCIECFFEKEEYVVCPNCEKHNIHFVFGSP